VVPTVATSESARASDFSPHVILAVIESVTSPLL